MGLFSDQCSECGAAIKKAARFCSTCGAMPPNGWCKCSACGKWVGQEAKFCWNCKEPFHPESREFMAGGKWTRPAGVFARRFETGDINPMLKTGLLIEPGNAAILMREGKVKDVLKPGRHDLKTLSDRIRLWGADSPKTVVMIDEGDIGLPLRVTGLRTQEDMEVEFYAEGIVRFNPREAEAVVKNLLHGQEEVTYADLAGKLAGELEYVLKNHCMASPIDELFKNPDRRNMLEDTLDKALKDCLKGNGLEFVRLGGMDFTGAAYEQLRAQAGEVETIRRKTQLDQRMRELLASDKMGQFKSEAELKDYVTQLAHEHDLGNVDRRGELELLQQVYRHELEIKDADHRIELTIRAGQERIEAAKLDVIVRDIKTQQDIKETNEWLKVKQDKRRLEVEHEREKGAVYETLSLETLIAMSQDPSQREHLVKLFELKMKAGISEKEILAQAQMDVAEAKQQTTAENADRLERIMKEAIQAMGEAAKGGNTIIR